MNKAVLFSCGEDLFTPAHVLAAAAHWGELDALYLESRMRNSASLRAMHEGIEVSDADLQEQSELFRRRHGLRTARATETWMATHGVTIQAFTDFLERDALLKRDLGAATKASRKHPTRDLETMALLWPDAVFTGMEAAWVQRLAAAAAAARDVMQKDGIPASLFDTTGGASIDGMRPWLDYLGLESDWCDRLRIFDAAFLHFSTSLQTKSKLDTALRIHWESLFAVEAELGSFPTEAAAREAQLCITEDGQTLAEICEEAGGVFQRGSLLLGDLPEAIRSSALSGTAGDLLPVFDWENSYVLCRVCSKIEPTLEDPRVRSFIASSLLEEALPVLLDRHIIWQQGATI